MLWKLLQRTFNGGQLDQRIGGRTDITKYFQAASVLKNFIVKRQGCIVKRRGTLDLADVTAKSGLSAIKDYRLIPFTYENYGGYVIAFLADGNDFTATRKICIFGKDGSLKKTINNIPYFGAEFAQIGYAQSGDMLYLAHQNHPFARINCLSDTDWTYEVIDFGKLGHTSLPAKPTISSVQLLPRGKWTGEGPSKSVTYVVTAVKDGVESLPSDPYVVSYNTPWPDGCVIKINVADQVKKPDGYNVYKKSFSGYGFIGTTQDGLASSSEGVVATIPLDQNLSQKFENLSLTPDPANAKGLVSRSTVVNDTTAAGFVGSGGYAALYANAIDVDNFVLSLGYVWYSGYSVDPEDGIYHHRISYLPCKAAQIGCKVVFEDYSEKDLGKKTVPGYNEDITNDDSTTGDPYDPTTSTKIANKRRAMSKGRSISFSVNDSRRVIVVGFYAYDAAGRSVSGSIVNNPEGFPTIEGKPFVLSGMWATKSSSKSDNGFLDEYITPDLSLTPPKYEPRFNDAGDYPGCVAIYQQRLALARTFNRPYTFFLSCVGDFYNFNTHSNLREDDAMEVTLPATRYPDINHMVLNRDLIMFCDSGEWIVSPISGNALTYQTISTKIQSQIGCSKEISPIVVGDDVIFANMTNETLIAIKYSYATDGYEATDLSVLSQDIFRGNPITSMAYKQHPDSIIVVTLKDGTIATLEYMKEHEVVAWSHHELGGGLKALYCCADGSVTNGTTDVYILAEDTKTGKVYLLRSKSDTALKSAEDAVSLDQMKTVDASAKDPEGFISVDLGAGKKMIGRPFTATFVSVKPEPNGKETVRLEVKNPTEVEIAVTEGSDFKVGQLGQDRAKDRLVKIPDFKPHDKATILAGANNKDGRICLTSDGPWPLTILSMATTYQIEQANEEPKRGGERND